MREVVAPREEVIEPDTRNARFFTIDDTDGSLAGDMRRLGFYDAYRRATRQINVGRSMTTLYMEGASQTAIKQSFSRGIPTELPVAADMAWRMRARPYFRESLRSLACHADDLKTGTADRPE